MIAHIPGFPDAGLRYCEVEMKHVLAGPFIGEFGWELFCWQGFLRKRRPDYDSMTVICRTGHRILYEDFAADIIEIDIPTGNVNMWKGCVRPESIVSYHKQSAEFTDFIPFDSYKDRWWIDPQYQLKQKFAAYGSQESSVGFDILIHVRNAHHCRTAFRNWKQEMAAEYAQWAISKGYSVACVGKSETALLIDGTEDRRDMPLSDLVNIMASSRVILGSQSGPHHLACLCRLPVIAWQTKPEHAERLSKYWNPFNVRTIVNHPKDNSYWDNKTKNTKHWEPRLQWLQDCTTAMLENIP